MLFRTHLALGMFFALILLPHVTHKVVFILVFAFATSLPDIDSALSKFGKSRIFRVVQVFTKHRGFLHSFTFCIAVSVFFAYFFPILALPFFFGYFVHLFADSFTVDGIRPFWPSAKVSQGKIRVGSMVEEAIFASFCIADVALLVSFFI